LIEEKKKIISHRIVEDNIYFLSIYYIYIYIYISYIYIKQYINISSIYDTIVQIITHIRHYRQDMQLYAIFFILPFREIPIKDSFLNLSLRISRNPLRNFTKYPLPCSPYRYLIYNMYVILMYNFR